MTLRHELFHDGVKSLLSQDVVTRITRDKLAVPAHDDSSSLGIGQSLHQTGDHVLH